MEQKSDKLTLAVSHVREQEDVSPWERLAGGIIAQAVVDYRASALVLRKGPKCPTRRLKTVKEVETFFRSRWFTQLADLDGEDFLREIRRRVEMEVSA